MTDDTNYEQAIINAYNGSSKETYNLLCSIPETSLDKLIIDFTRNGHHHLAGIITGYMWELWERREDLSLIMQGKYASIAYRNRVWELYGYHSMAEMYRDFEARRSQGDAIPPHRDPVLGLLERKSYTTVMNLRNVWNFYVEELKWSPEQCATIGVAKLIALKSTVEKQYSLWQDGKINDDIGRLMPATPPSSAGDSVSNAVVPSHVNNLPQFLSEDTRYLLDPSVPYRAMRDNVNNKPTQEQDAPVASSPFIIVNEESGKMICNGRDVGNFKIETPDDKLFVGKIISGIARWGWQ